MEDQIDSTKHTEAEFVDTRSVGRILHPRLAMLPCEGVSTTLSYFQCGRFFAACGICFLVALAMTGCGRRHNVEPNEPDYPILNPTPKIVIHLVVIAPPSIPTKFLVGYVSNADSVPNQTPSTCWYSTGLGNLHSFGVGDTLSLKRKGDYQSGDIRIDKYLPGRCDYRFASSWFSAPDEESQQELFHFDHGAPHGTTARIDLWCVTVPIPKQPNKQCAPLWLWKANLPELMTPPIYDQIVASGGDKGPPIEVGPDTRSITVQFHDLNAADGGREVLGR
jgi:hypothetical protein